MLAIARMSCCSMLMSFPSKASQFLTIGIFKQWMTKARNYAKNKLRDEDMNRTCLSNGRSKLLDENTDANIECCYFKNGMRLVCECKESFTTSIGCFLPAGAIHERPEERGSALFLEHLLFRKTCHRNQQQLEKEVEDAGGSINTIATRDMLVFYGSLLSKRANVLIELFADVILHGETSEAHLEAEKCVILRELCNIELDNERTIMDYLPTVAYQGTPLAKSIYPETSVVENFNVESLISFRCRLMKPYFTTLISTGSLSLCQLQEMICQYFSTEVCNVMPRLEDESHGYRFSGADFRLRDDREKVAYVALGIEGPAYGEAQDYITFKVAQAFVGSWDRTYGGSNHNAPFIAHCAFNTELCYMYKSFYLNWRKASIWGCYFVADKMRLEIMAEGIQKEWMKLCSTVTEKQIQRAVNQCKFHELLKQHDSVERLLDLIRNFSLRGNYETTRMTLSRYEAITTDSMREMAIKYIYNKSPVVVALGRIENLPDYCNLEDGLYLLQY